RGFVAFEAQSSTPVRWPVTHCPINEPKLLVSDHLPDGLSFLSVVVPGKLYIPPDRPAQGVYWKRQETEGQKAQPTAFRFHGKSFQGKCEGISVIKRIRRHSTTIPPQKFPRIARPDSSPMA